MYLDKFSLSKIHSKLLAKETESFIYKLCLLRTQESERPNEIYRETLNSLTDIFENLRNNLYDGENYRDLREFVSNWKLKRLEERQLLKDIEESKENELTLTNELRNFTLEAKEEMNNVENQICELDQKHMESILNFGVKNRYFNTFLDSVSGGNDLRFHFQKRDFEKQLDDINMAVTIENEAMHRIRLFYKESTMKLKMDTEHILDEHERLNDELDIEYKLTLKDKSDVEKTINEDKELAAERQKFIDEYEEEQERIRVYQEFLKERTQIALTLQSWWRGVMVRRFLGEFKKYRKRAREIKKQRLEAARAQQAQKKSRKKK